MVGPRHLYVHVPFCGRRCSYCDFAVQVARPVPVEAWLDAVERELAAVVRLAGWSEPLELATLYVGGGTPSLLGRGAMAELARRLRRFVRWDPDGVEWTAEANPESMDASLAVDWRSAGVNRVSLGVQSFDDRALRWMGRLHGSDGPGQAVRALRRAGVDDVSVDLIFGLPKRLGRDWQLDLDHALALEPEHVSLYGLTAEPATPLGRWVADGRERMAPDEAYQEEYLAAVGRLTDAGFHQYEVSNFARPGRASRHNGAYWSGAAYLGLGPSAHSYLPPERCWNVRDWDAYRAAVERGEDATAERERVLGEAAELERTWLALRTVRGLPAAGLSARQLALTDRWREEGWVQAVGDGVRLTPAGWLLLDRLAVDLVSASRGTALDAARAVASHSVVAPPPGLDRSR